MTNNTFQLDGSDLERMMCNLLGIGTPEGTPEGIYYLPEPVRKKDMLDLLYTDEAWIRIRKSVEHGLKQKGLPSVWPQWSVPTILDRCGIDHLLSIQGYGVAIDYTMNTAKVDDKIDRLERRHSAYADIGVDASVCVHIVGYVGQTITPKLRAHYKYHVLDLLEDVAREGIHGDYILWDMPKPKPKP